MKLGSSAVLWVLTLSAASAALAFAQQTEPKWQTSWADFIRILGPELGPYPMNPVNPAYKQFAGKTVTWEGVLGDIGADADTRIRMVMSPDSSHGYEVNVQLFPKAGEFPRWKGTRLGTRVRFRAVIDTVFPILTMRFGITSGPLVAAVMASSAELLDPAKKP